MSETAESLYAVYGMVTRGCTQGYRCGHAWPHIGLPGQFALSQEPDTVPVYATVAVAHGRHGLGGLFHFMCYLPPWKPDNRSPLS